ncbi:MAG: hypothetical protein IJN07_07175, partial [Clostridia bacterium]|nr:hypothetical protein [Clostridia bacterium]
MFQSVSKRLLKLWALIACAAVIICFGVFAVPSFAAQSLSLSASNVVSSQVTVTVDFPLVDWSGGFKILMSFDPSVLEYESCSCNI